LVSHIKISLYEQLIPISQLGSISTPDAKTIYVQVYDKQYAKEISKAISLDLNLKPQHLGNNIIINLPQVTEERRIEYVTKAKKYSEETKMAIRNHRKIIFAELKHFQKILSRDDFDKQKKLIDEQVRLHNKEVDDFFVSKKKELINF
jgi:ribosome recycling factor